jgi:TRAP-type C4-dicarboxylate transport system permease small subunit
MRSCVVVCVCVLVACCLCVGGGSFFLASRTGTNSHAILAFPTARNAFGVVVGRSLCHLAPCMHL